MMLITLLLFVRTFHPVSISDLAAGDPRHFAKAHTHVQVSGWVTYRKKEDDGDWHLRICDTPQIRCMDRKHCIVAEIIPELPLTPPKRGEKVTLWGIYRYDGERNHNFVEIHPVIGWKKENA